MLAPGRYPRLKIRWKRGTPENPISIIGQAGVIFDGQRRYEDFQDEANGEARRLLAAGRYPGVYTLGPDGHLIFQNCRHIRLQGAAFRGCWPTGIAIRDCRDITLADLDMQEGSFAIFADGSGTYGLLIERCSWTQDIERGRIWNDIPWPKIHANIPIKDDDGRAFDGDFFRADGIRGGVTIRDCRVEHAFNAIHLYHSDSEGRSRRQNRDVRIYRNHFSYIRDNAIEPEYGATNWWVFHNQVFNCHKWFSIECKRMAYTYWFGNTGWFDSIPTPDFGHNGGAVWKTERNPKPTNGLNYLFNNSFFLRSPYIKNKRLRSARHFNNAIQYCDPADFPNDACDGPAGFFGDKDGPDIDSRFTKAWRELNIRFQNDMVAHPEFPQALADAGYGIDGGLSDAPGFIDPVSGDFRLSDNAPAAGRGVPKTLDLENGDEWPLPSGLDLGAWQGGKLIAPPAFAFGAAEAPLV